MQTRCPLPNPHTRQFPIAATTRYSRRVFLFLQGPHCGFFSGLAERLEMEGHRCLRINLCVSDWLFWRRPGAVNFRKSFDAWPEFLRAFFREHRVTDLILLGEQRPYHKVAVAVAEEFGAEVTVTEWGYLRPDWITFERQGMSGRSLFPKDPAKIFELAEQVAEPDMRRLYPDSYWRLALSGGTADIADWFYGFFFPRYQTHLVRNPVLLYFSTALRQFRAHRMRLQTRRTINEWVRSAEQSPYFVLPMQIEADFQIRAYSPFENFNQVLDLVLKSFACHAAAEDRLMVKVHPMDPGLKNWARILHQIAEPLGIAERVGYVDGGSFERLIGNCKGVVTVNSTSGVAAIQFGKAVKTLGQAIYDIPGLTSQKPLNDFWCNPEPPDLALRDAFVKALAGCIQIKGGFFSARGMHSAIEEAAGRLLNRQVNLPLKIDPRAGGSAPLPPLSGKTSANSKASRPIR